jgi:hypothetical protein
LQAGVAAVQAADTSVYTVASPAIRGPIPRLAREILVDTLNLVYRDLGGRGSELSGELLGALALGFDGEVGNFILRYSSLKGSFLSLPCSLLVRLWLLRML